MVGMTLTSCLFRHRYSAKGTVVKKISLINKGIFHLIDDIFWNLGFKNETQAEKVILIIRIILIIFITHIIQVIFIKPNYINYIAGSYQYRNCRSRMAG